MEITLGRAGPLNRPQINELIARSKSHWPWPPEYLQAALPLLEVSARYLNENPCAVATNASGEIVAFGSLASADERVYIDNLWVHPDRIGTGIGGRLCDWLLDHARDRDLDELWVLPDPPAEGFYLKRGFEDTGERVPSRIAGGPVFSLLKIRL